MENNAHVLYLCAQQAVYMVSFSWLAWKGERSTGIDAFHLAIPLLGGLYIISLITLQPFHFLIIAILLAAVLCLVDYLFIDMLAHSKIDSDQNLIFIILAAIFALLTFRILTDFAPLDVSRPLGRLFVLAGTSAGLVASFVLFVIRGGREVLKLRLGFRNQWALRYWSRPVPQRGWVFILVSVLAWIAVILGPLGGTGVSSNTVFLDLILATLIARSIGTGSLLYLIAVAALVGAVQPLVGFIVTYENYEVIPKIASVFILLMFIRSKDYRGTLAEKQRVHI